MIPKMRDVFLMKESTDVPEWRRKISPAAMQAATELKSIETKMGLLMHDGQPNWENVMNALEAIGKGDGELAVGTIGNKRFLSMISHALTSAARSYTTEDDQDRELLKQPFHALADFGDDVDKVLTAELEDPDCDITIHSFIGRIRNSTKDLEQALSSGAA